MEIKAKRGLPLHMLMLIGFLVGLTGGLIVNLTVGGDVGWVQWLTSNITGPAGQIFLRLLFMLVLPLLGVVMVIGETLGTLVTNPRLRARHRYARALRTRQASVDLDIARERRGAPTPNSKP